MREGYFRDGMTNDVMSVLTMTEIQSKVAWMSFLSGSRVSLQWKCDPGLRLYRNELFMQGSNTFGPGMKRECCFV